MEYYALEKIYRAQRLVEIKMSEELSVNVFWTSIFLYKNILIWHKCDNIFYACFEERFVFNLNYLLKQLYKLKSKDEPLKEKKRKKKMVLKK